MEEKYLYHYTSIETLALILRYKTIRFTSLASVDDLNEAKTEDYGDIGRFCFVSCWTNMKEESIPLWKMYTSDMRGVRIRLPITPFKKYKVSKGEHNNSEEFYSYINFKEHYSCDGKGYNISPIDEKLFVFPIEYTNNKEYLFPKVKSRKDTPNGYEETIRTSEIGKYKEKVWEFQREWRYKLFIAPWTMKEAEDSKTVEDQINLFKRFKDYKLPFDFYDLTLDENQFEDMEILLGPKTTVAEEIIVNALINKYNKNAKVVKSNLYIK